MTMRNAIAGRTALVSGGGNGLGRAISARLVQNGVRVIIIGRDIDKLKAVCNELGTDVVAQACDVSDEAQVAALAKTMQRESISILVNNAGIAGPVAQLTSVTAEEWDEVFAVNVKGVFLMCRAFIPPMTQMGSGDVINIASVSGKRPLSGRTPYTASKMAVIGLTATLAQEVGPSGVMVNSLSPGPVAGPRMSRNFALEAARKGSTVEHAKDEFVSRSALRRMVTEGEVADAVIAMLHMPGLCAADVDLSAGMVAR
jgi:NAD(P)-dependent dehydrogenase (short-subunit alcohol dehydrogenase family)